MDEEAWRLGFTPPPAMADLQYRRLIAELADLRQRMEAQEALLRRIIAKLEA